LGRPFGIPVFITPSSIGLAILIMIGFAPTVRERLPDIGGLLYVVTASFAILLLASILLHELAHSVVAKLLGLPVRRIVLQLLGGASELEREPETPWREFAVAVAGPLVSLLLGIGAAIGYWATEPDTMEGLIIGAFAVSNILVGLFNLLPGLPLDGGRVLRAIVWAITRRPNVGTIAAAWGGRAVALAVIVSPFVLAQIQNRQIDLVNVLWAALLASFIWTAATASLAQQRLRERLPSLRARSLARRAFPVTGDLPLSEALRRAREAGAGGLVIVDGGGAPSGLVNEASVSATPEHRRPWVFVSSVARSIEPGLVLSAELSGEDLVRAMQATPASEYLVVEQGGDIFGVLATKDVERAFAHAG
jgi:Zn-dependent protease/CBS domain-containing protein